MSRRFTHADRGTTLVELLTSMSIMAIMLAVATSAFVSYRASSEHSGARDTVVSTLRNASERALSEQRTYCVSFSTSAWSLYRAACSGTGSVAIKTDVSLDAAQETMTGSFSHPAGHASACGTGACVYFYPRGNSSDGTLTIRRDGRTDHVVDVEGLTSRVSTSG